MAFTALAIAAAAAVAKSELVDKPKEDRQRKLAAATQRWSPWTGLQAQPIQEADPIGSALSWGAAGAQLGQGLSNDQANNALKGQIGDSLAAGAGGTDGGAAASYFKGANPFSADATATSNPGWSLGANGQNFFGTPNGAPQPVSAWSQYANGKG